MADATTCGICGGTKLVPYRGTMVECQHCSPAALARSAERQQRNAARSAAAKMIRIANGGPHDLFPLPSTPMPRGELGGPAKNACCDQARERACVCMRSYECPVHGTKCIGTHD